MGRASFFMVLYLFVKESDIDPWVAGIAVIVGAIILARFDSRYVLEDENTTAVLRSPLWAKFLKEWDEFYGRCSGRNNT